MPASSHGPAGRAAASLLLALLVGGCAAETSTSTASDAGATTTTVAPTTTTAPPLTARERAWLATMPKVARKVERSIKATSHLDGSGLTRLATAFRSCGRELVAGGPPSDRLRPVYLLAKKACKEYDKGAACFAAAARIGIPFSGSPEERRLTRAIDCGFAGQRKGSTALIKAANKGEELRVEVG